MLIIPKKKITPKFGFVALVDAMGARTADMKQAIQYLEAVERIKFEIDDSLDATLSDLAVHKRMRYGNLKPMFFGDSILLTYEIKKKDDFLEVFRRMCFVLKAIIPQGLSEGIMFRGALTVGQYIERDEVVLGPAVVDAANWYEELECAGIMITPSGAYQVRHYYESEFPGMLEASCGTNHLIKYNIPTKNGLIDGFMLSWPESIKFYNTEKDENLMAWFYRVIKGFSIPLGTEQKYKNTENFIDHFVKSTSIKHNLKKHK